TGPVLSAGGTDYRFDGLGRTIESGDLRLSYGPHGQIAHAQRGAAEFYFLYDETGERILKLTADMPAAAYLAEGFLDVTGLTERVSFGGVLVGVMRTSSLQLLPVDGRGTVQGSSDGVARIASPFGNRALHPDIAAAVDFVSKGFDADLGTVRMGVRD